MTTKKHSKPTRAKVRTAKTPAAPSAPPRCLLSDHIRVQRKLLFQAAGILECVRHVMDDTPIGTPDQPRALEAALALIDKVTDALEGIGDLKVPAVAS